MHVTKNIHKCLTRQCFQETFLHTTKKIAFSIEINYVFVLTVSHQLFIKFPGYTYLHQN